MKNSLRPSLALGLRPVLLLVVIVAVAGFLLQREPQPPASDTDARIAWYRQRLGGRDTYPHYARLGLACLQRARETGQSQWYAEAERALRQSLEYQTNFEALYGMASVLAARHDFTAAQRFAEEALGASQESLETQGLLFDIAMAFGDTQKATGILERMTARALGAFEVSARQAALHEYRGELREALRAIEATCADASRANLPVAGRAWCEVRRGALLLSSGCDASGAERAYHSALRILPGYYFAREHQAELRAAQGDPGKAIAIYEDLLQDLPSPAYRLALADVYEVAGRKKDALRARLLAQAELGRSVEGNSRGDFLEYIFLVADKKEHAPRALRLAESEWAVRRDWLTADALAWAYFHNGRIEEAAKAAAAALATGSKSNALRLRAAEIYLRAGRREAAAKLLQQAVACPAALVPGELAQAERLRAALASPSPVH